MMTYLGISANQTPFTKHVKDNTIHAKKQILVYDKTCKTYQES